MLLKGLASSRRERFGVEFVTYPYLHRCYHLIHSAFLLAKPGGAYRVNSLRRPVWSAIVRTDIKPGGSSAKGILIVACILLAGCAHKPAPAGPQYPAVPEASVRLLAAAPNPPFAQLGVVTIQDRLANMPGDTWTQVRTMAARAGANRVFVRGQKTFWLRDPATRQRVRMQRIVFQLVYLP